MIPTIIAVSLAFYWLLIETDYLRVRLLVGAEKPHSAGRTMAQWEVYNKAHAKEIEKAQREYAERQAIIKSHTCLVCGKHDDALLIETKIIQVGNSTCHVTGCPDCIEKFRQDIENSQREAKPRKPSFAHTQLPMFIEQVRIGSHREWVETTPKHGYHNTVTEYTTRYHDCLCGKDWLKAHEHDEYPEPTIELSIDGKSISVNGNYKKGVIQGFMSEYTHKVRAGRKTMTAMIGQQAVNCGGGVYIIE